MTDKIHCTHWRQTDRQTHTHTHTERHSLVSRSSSDCSAVKGYPVCVCFRCYTHVQNCIHTYAHTQYTHTHSTHTHTVHTHTHTHTHTSGEEVRKKVASAVRRLVLSNYGHRGMWKCQKRPTRVVKSIKSGLCVW